jgi:hypothetical protein
MAFIEETHIGRLTVDAIMGAGALPYTQGKKYFVDPVNGSDNPAGGGKDPAHAFKTLAAAEDACVSGRNDTVYFLASTSGDTQTAVLSWDKSYTHLIGVCATAAESHRARIFSPNSATAGYSPMVSFSGQGCIIKNMAFKQQSYHADSHHCAQVTGGRNYFENVHFAGMLHATPAGDTNGGSLFLGGAEENLFKNCVIGQDTIQSTAANAQLRIDDYGRNNRNKFDGCLFYTNASAATTWVLIDAESVGGYLWFKDCTFLNKGTTMTVGMTVGANTGGIVLLDNILYYGATNFLVANAAVIVGRTPETKAVDTGLAFAFDETP